MRMLRLALMISPPSGCRLPMTICSWVVLPAPFTPDRQRPQHGIKHTGHYGVPTCDPCLQMMHNISISNVGAQVARVDALPTKPTRSLFFTSQVQFFSTCWFLKVIEICIAAAKHLCGYVLVVRNCSRIQSWLLHTQCAVKHMSRAQLIALQQAQPTISEDLFYNYMCICSPLQVVCRMRCQTCLPCWCCP